MLDKVSGLKVSRDKVAENRIAEARGLEGKIFLPMIAVIAIFFGNEAIT